MRLVDLSREIYHKMPRLVNHPSIIVTEFSNHDEVREADGYKFSSATLNLSLGDHAGTHVDAPCHFDSSSEALSIDQIPLETYFTEAVCLDLSFKPLKSDIACAVFFLDAPLVYFFHVLRLALSILVLCKSYNPCILHLAPCKPYAYLFKL